MSTAESLNTATPSAAVIAARLALSRIFSTERPGFVVCVGPCAATVDAFDTLSREGEAKMTLNDPSRGIIMVDREPIWKPRSDPRSWHGLDSVPETVQAARKFITSRAQKAANVAIEVGFDVHLPRYGDYLTFAWIGSRNTSNNARNLVEAVARYDPCLPIGIKNDMTGNIDSALTFVKIIKDIRGSRGAPAVLIFRGGEQLRTPEVWARAYMDAIEKTDGRLIVDAAHGGEMAHDPKGQFKKSVEGQVRCLEHIQAIHSRIGKAGLGVMIEATDAISQTDPVIPFTTAIAFALDLANRKLSTLTPAA